MNANAKWVAFVRSRATSGPSGTFYALRPRGAFGLSSTILTSCASSCTYMSSSTARPLPRLAEEVKEKGGQESCFHGEAYFSSPIPS